MDEGHGEPNLGRTEIANGQDRQVKQVREGRPQPSLNISITSVVRLGAPDRQRYLSTACILQILEGLPLSEHGTSAMVNNWLIKLYWSFEFWRTWLTRFGGASGSC